MKWKIITETTVFKADGTDLLLEANTIMEQINGVYIVDGDVIVITSSQIEQNPDTYKLQSPKYNYDTVSRSGKSIQIQFDKIVPTLTQSQKDTLGNIVQIWLNQNHG